MKKNIIIMVCAISMFIGFNACKSKNSVMEKGDLSSISTLHNSQNSLDWWGTYTGVVPCADCSGIATRVTLNKDGNYAMVRKYIDKGDAFETKGTFVWNEAGSAVVLTDSKDKTVTNFSVGEGKLTQLDLEGKVISGNLANNYVLAKVDNLLVGKRWRLVELNGKPVSKKDAFLTFDPNSDSVSGNLGCNDFSGTYNLKPGNRIEFSQVVSTLKMCLNMDTENGFKKILDMVDNYNVSENKLSLNRARMAPLARFELEKY